MTDEPEVPEPPPRKSPHKRGGKNKPGQQQRQRANAKALRILGVHKPARAASATDVKTMKQLKEMLSVTWNQVVERANDFKRFSPKQLEFYKRYAINGRRNRTACARAAGYQSDNPMVLLEMANRNLRMHHAEDLIAAFELEEKARMGLRVEDVAAWFERIATQAMDAGDFANANRAMESYAKYLGMFTERKEITHRTVHSEKELDARIAELHTILSEERDAISKKLSIN